MTDRLAERIRKHRFIEKLNQRELSERIGISVSTLAKLESGVPVGQGSLAKIENWLQEKEEFHIYKFAKENCVHNPSYSVPEYMLWEYYVHWCQDQGIEFVSKSRLRTAMQKLGYKVVPSTTEEPIKARVYFHTNLT